MLSYEDVINFWFEEIEPAQHWKKDIEFDGMIAERFGKLHHQATLCELFDWRESPLGRLAEIIVLDQFSRNMYRDTPLSFAYDPQALTLAQEAVALEADETLSTLQRTFLYMPYMHSESLKVHEVALALYTKNGVQSNLDFEIQHNKIIEQFGRYPHRNAILGRESSPAEEDFLKQPGSSF
ncbi:MAG: hypothetical protein COA71_03345 [SAR86 cluster bacterium]|uniref:DUF924 domain-containing protein n=1 Tax=SAR86 cluster bacterium TaxID=2030880 RepID=A0A2A5CGG3_9GAMM|nr:DUF924 domain-containing protein [bacterium AH-315-I11]MBN4075843.1 DUF924 domain-containing protein [Gammaproteobacteria bacterium AH-315-E17]PCJ42560.1 MAG: hypothetical protein COA71_03345 [SAR86 cluster bacterium]